MIAVGVAPSRILVVDDVEANRVLLQEILELDLAVFDLPRRLHDMALYEQTRCSRVVLVIERECHDDRRRDL